MTPSVSIIVPIHNAESTLRRCVDSILGQTLKDIQIILVNDASDDDSGRIIEEYALDNENVIPVISKGGGPGYARNQGLPFATGEYVGFVDSDDYVDREMYEKLFLTAKRNDSDIAVCDYKGPSTEERHLDNYPDVFSFGTDILSFENFHSSPFLFFVWRGIYRRNFLSLNNISFCNYMFGEDLLFNMSVYFVCNKVALLKENLYIYDNLNASSITRKKFKPRFFEALQDLYYEKIKIYQKCNAVSYECDLDLNTMRCTLPNLLSNMLANPEGISISELRRIRESSMVTSSYRSVSPSVIGSNLKYLAYLLKYRLYFIAKLLMDMKR